MSHLDTRHMRLPFEHSRKAATENGENRRDVFFRILGPLQVTIRDNIVRVGRNRQLTILAVLLINANKVVPVSTLIDAVWSAAPPATADKQIQTCVWRLRTVIKQTGGPTGLLETAPSGYLLRLPDGCTDADVFEEAVSRARRRWTTAIWRGPWRSTARHWPCTGGSPWPNWKAGPSNRSRRTGRNAGSRYWRNASTSNWPWAGTGTWSAN